MGMARPHRAGLATLLGLLALAACATHPPAAGPTAPPKPVPVAVAVPADAAALVAADDQFGLDLLTAPDLPKDGNLAISPASVAIALQMVATGARGTTATQLASVLHLPNAASAATSAQALLSGLRDAEQDHRNTLRVANTVWTQRGLPVLPAFSDTLRTRFASALHTIDFARDPDGARQRVNSTVAGQTNGLIPQLFPAGTLDDSTRLVLTNAIYLAASWATAFPQDKTAPGPFTKADGSVSNVPMMHSDDPSAELPAAFGYATGPGYQVVTLPYVGGKLAFTVLLPNTTSLTPVLDALRDKGLPAVLKDVKPTRVALAMPKFTVHTDLDLSATLAALGMPAAFGGGADFTGITTAEHLQIQTVRHDAVVHVDEHGTTAAAATGVGIQATAGIALLPVNVNHPFLFVITDTATGAPLFLGRVTDPS
ncbi:MAG TPA: serpin family protein [Pseudonocardiaceae bacterium]|nr:serpin family protein [Pseudonocardiaceae bacterium]